MSDPTTGCEECGTVDTRHDTDCETALWAIDPEAFDPAGPIYTSPHMAYRRMAAREQLRRTAGVYSLPERAERTTDMTPYEVGKRMRFNFSGNVYLIREVDAVERTVTFARPGDLEDATTETVEDLDGHVTVLP